MCVIAFVPNGETISEDTLKKCFTKNPDGWGIMWHQDGKVQFSKNTTSFDDFMKHWDAVKDLNSHKVLHFRIATHGAVNPRNCHPFSIQTKDGEYQMMHNGVLSIPCINKSMSDTWHYARLLESVIQHYPKPFDAVQVSTGIQDTLGSSKLAIMTTAGAVHYWGTWTEIQGCMFSNNFWSYTSTYKSTFQKDAGATKAADDKSASQWAEKHLCPMHKNPTDAQCKACMTMPCLMKADLSCCSDCEVQNDSGGSTPSLDDIPTFDDIIEEIIEDIAAKDYDNVILTINDHSLLIKDLITLIPNKDEWMPELLQAAVDIAVS